MRSMLTVIATAAALVVPTTPAQAADPVTKTVELLNTYRAKHGAPPLSLDSEVSNTAQQWADHLHETNDFQHRPNNPYGENLYWTSSRTRAIDTVATNALENWYRESRGYDYSKEMTQSNVNYDVLHFTAMVWKSSTRVGVGLKQGKNGIYVVVNFAERGNTLNHFRANIHPPVTAR
ncbi:CAP family protein [Lentzea sp. BCCO 10_0856]|uniref:CAP family protein n=1 Tax=Lentzea miocenica TaxID=3095431 RepID=A0ABU4TDY1_9PSEU|nr:CAP family protein [Lentzea sp. BCCO 10_0856]MDX8036395.1 CAP family protein [Lentzea sp. BCCO 10_0856]